MTSIRLSTEASAAVARDLEPGETLRIVFAGGCGAMGFRLAPARRAYPGDERVAAESDGGGAVELLLDARAAQELDGAVLEYDPDEGFHIEHPEWGLSC
jgi:Fe-S cluster assembly iron-binding protein IscA